MRAPTVRMGVRGRGISRFPGDSQVDKGWIVDYNK